MSQSTPPEGSVEANLTIEGNYFPRDPDGGPYSATRVAGCNTNTDCESGWCVEGQIGFICTESCVTDCPEGFDCKAASVGGQARCCSRQRFTSR